MAMIGRGRAVLPEERAALAMGLEVAIPRGGVAIGQFTETPQIFAEALEFRIDDRVWPISCDDAPFPARLPHFLVVLQGIERALGGGDRLDAEPLEERAGPELLGLQSRIDTVRDYVEEHARVGNFYVNRNQIGAVVGSQPFGGEGLSGTGPKAGGLHYVARFATERVTCIDTTAAGGNASLMASIEG